MTLRVTENESRHLIACRLHRCVTIAHKPKNVERLDGQHGERCDQQSVQNAKHGGVEALEFPAKRVRAPIDRSLACTLPRASASTSYQRRRAAAASRVGVCALACRDRGRVSVSASVSARASSTRKAARRRLRRLGR